MKNLVIYPGRRTLRMTDCLGLRAQLLVDTLKCDILDVDTERTIMKDRYDRIILIEGIFRFVSQDFRDKTEWMINNCRKEVVYATADYESRVPSLAKWLPVGVKPFRWSQFALPVVKERDFPFVNTKIVNWNAILWQEPITYREYDLDGLFYYGNYKEDRIDFYNKYLRDAPYPVFISARKGQSLDYGIPDITYLEPADCLGDLQSAKFTVYFLNRGAVGTAPAQRFYECLAAGVPILIDRAFALDLNHLPEVERFLVDGPEDVRIWNERLSHWQARKNVVEWQRDKWAKDYKTLLIEQIKEAAK